MNWASFAIEKLKLGQQTIIYPKGNSMLPKVISGAEVTLEPVNNIELQVGDIVLVSIGRAVYLHLIVAIKDNQYLIANNKGKNNGWTNKEHIYGRAFKINNKISVDKFVAVAK